MTRQEGIKSFQFKESLAKEAQKKHQLCGKLLGTKYLLTTTEDSPIPSSNQN